jgi:hypothetical protein
MACGRGGWIVSRSLAVVYEAPADFRTATDLADRVLIEAFDWLEPEDVQHQRNWLGDHAGDPLTWTRVKQLASEKGIVASGHFDGEPAAPDAAAARRAFRLLRVLFPELAGVMFVRDQDDQEDRRLGLEQARNLDEVKIPVVVGLAVVERECWVISGFVPRDPPEEKRLTEERGTLGFDPRHRSHELTAGKDDQAPRSPKRVLRKLSGGVQEREQRCWRETALDILVERGKDNGLKLFLEEVRERFAPLIGHVAEG